MDRRFSETKLGALGEDVPEGRNRTDRGLSQGKLHYALGLREIRCSTRILFWGVDVRVPFCAELRLRMLASALRSQLADVTHTNWKIRDAKCMS